MKLQSTLAIACSTLVLALAGTAAEAQVVNIDATSATGTTVNLGAGTYQISWAGISGGGLYDAWQYNTAPSGNFRDAFTMTSGGVTTTYDRNDGITSFNNYSTAAAAIGDFQTASGANAIAVYNNSATDASVSGTTTAPITFTLSAPGTVNFSVPDNFLVDNKGGVSLAIAAAVPEPENYAMVLIGLCGVGVVARRRTSKQA